MTLGVVTSAPGVAETIRTAAAARGLDVCVSAAPPRAAGEWLAIFIDWPLGHSAAAVLDVLEVAVTGPSRIPVIVILPRGLPQLLHRALAAGAANVLLLPLDQAEVGAELDQILAGSPGSDGEMRVRFERLRRSSLVGASPAFRRCMVELQQAASCDANVLLLGETGTGKEMIARAIHELSSRSAQPYVPVNLAGLSGTLIESELFGHVKGAFTHADRNRPGRFATAGAGTLLLDEIGDLDTALQTKLLRVIETREYERVGDDRPSAFHGRIIAATSMDLNAAIASGRFRPDLMGRLDQFRIEIPPLRRRHGDVALLAAHFLEKHRKGRPIDISSSALDVLCAFDYPLNVRQLENAIIGAVARCYPSPLIMVKHLRDVFPSAPQAEESYTIEIAKSCSYAEARKRALEAVDGRHLPALLKQHQGNQSAAAESIGIDRKTFAARLKAADGARLDHAAGGQVDGAVMPAPGEDGIALEKIEFPRDDS